MSEPKSMPNQRGETKLLDFPPGAKPLVVSGKDTIVKEITAFFIDGYFKEGGRLRKMENEYGKQFMELREEREDLNKQAKSLSYKKGDSASKAIFDEKMGEITKEQTDLEGRYDALMDDFKEKLEHDFPFIAHDNIQFDKVTKTGEGEYRILDQKKSKATMEGIVKKAVGDVLSYGGKVSAAAKATQKNFEAGKTDVVYLGMGGGPVTIGVSGSSENVVKFNAVLSDKLIESLSEPLERAGIKIQQKGFKQESVFVSVLSPPTEFQKESSG